MTFVIVINPVPLDAIVADAPPGFVIVSPATNSFEEPVIAPGEKFIFAVVETTEGGISYPEPLLFIKT